MARGSVDGARQCGLRGQITPRRPASAGQHPPPKTLLPPEPGPPSHTVPAAEASRHATAQPGGRRKLRASQRGVGVPPPLGLGLQEITTRTRDAPTGDTQLQTRQTAHNKDDDGTQQADAHGTSQTMQHRRQTTHLDRRNIRHRSTLPLFVLVQPLSPCGALGGKAYRGPEIRQFSGQRDLELIIEATQGLVFNHQLRVKALGPLRCRPHSSSRRVHYPMRERRPSNQQRVPPRT